jgi:hypothetical protein
VDGQQLQETNLEVAGVIILLVVADRQVNQAPQDQKENKLL